MSKKMTLAMTAITLAAATAAQFGTTASAANPCSGIPDNRTAIEQALYEKFGGSDGKVEIEDGQDWDDLTATGRGTVTDISGCTIKYRVPVQKSKVSFQPGEYGQTITRDGVIEWMIGFDHDEGNRFCVAGNTMKEAEWDGENNIRERRFVRKNEKKRAFFGCTFPNQSQPTPQSSGLSVSQSDLANAASGAATRR